MPAPNKDLKIDLEENSTGRDLRHDSNNGRYEADADNKMSRLASTSSKGADTQNPPYVSSLNEDGRLGITNHQTFPSQSGRSDGLLHIPDGSVSLRRPSSTEPPVWDWDTPLESVGETTSYYFEPQGELLQEQHTTRPQRSEFTIPHAVSSANQQYTLSTAGSHTSDTFAVPKRPQSIPSSLAGNKRKSTSDRETSESGKQPDPKRSSARMLMAEAKDDGTSSTGAPAHNTRSQGEAATGQRAATEGSDAEAMRAEADNASRRTLENPSIPMVLPPRKVFPIQIGDKLFRLSGASISSDAPSYFSQFFEEQLRQTEGAETVRTLYIDRDPATFEDIVLHLQGYHIEPRDGPHFVKLFADAQFFSLPRLTNQLFSSTIYIRIGDEEFQIPRDLFSNPGDSPNYFSLGFAIFFTTPTEVFPGLSQRTLLRPPSILPPSIPNRSAKTFADILHFLKGYPVEIRSEQHRAELLRDVRYFHLKGLEQRLIPHTISYNLARKRTEIVIRLEDIRQSGITFIPDSATQAAEDASPASSTTSSTPNGPGWIHYQRPYVDSEAYTLIVEIAGDESTFLSIAPGQAASTARIGRAMFHRQTLARITSLFSVIANKMNLPITQPLGLMMMERGAGVASLPVSPGNTGVSEERVKCRIGGDADVMVDGKRWIIAAGEDDDDDDDDEYDDMEVDSSESIAARRRARKRKRLADDEEGEQWVLRRAQWRLRVQPISGNAPAGRSGMEVILGAVRIEAYSNEKARNVAKGFLV